ncbi:hypothetical protein MYP_1279 [Sporocytophaga myxococcoides]|uniref:Acyltransferase 3 domain-containing protein n=1 Tax=Sporocytophaga myxococcoides TaxID=153721 RepID=A0A098LAQ8_9BACT|nr:acyltransferase [Sporocytophaga myxococcoides]GAL84051.1 hypothetical protein MYP_1279 [Sporocytophaga myxococcoides]
MDKEIKSLTGIRGIAALWVVFLHYYETLSFSKDTYINNLLFSKALIAVDMFFLLSAIVMCIAYAGEFQKAISKHSYINFMKKRFARIYPAYFFWSFMFLLVFDFSKFKFDFSKILVNLLLLQNLFTDSVISIVFWSLCAEWIMYLIFPFLFSVISNARVGLINVLLIIVSIIGFYYLPSMNNYLLDLNKGLSVVHPTGNVVIVKGVNSVIRCFFAYLIGINLFFLIKSYYNFIANYWIKVLKYFAIGSSFMIPIFGISAEMYVCLFVCSIILICVLYLENDNKDPFFASNLIYFLGQISYSIYLCHMFILIFASVLVKTFFPLHYNNSIQIYLVIGSLVFLIPISYLSYKFTEVKTGLWLKSKLVPKLSGRDLRIT